MDELFTLWDTDRKGYLDTDDFARVVEVCRELERNGRPSLRMDSSLEEGFAMDKRAMVIRVVTEAAALDAHNMVGSVRAVVCHYSDAIKQLRADELYDAWISQLQAQSLLVRDLHHTIALFNTQDKEDWDSCGWPLNRKQQIMVHRRIPLIRDFKLATTGGMVGLKEFRQYICTASHLSSDAEPRIGFNAMVAKFGQLARYVENAPENLQASSPPPSPSLRSLEQLPSFDRPHVVSRNTETGRFNSCKW